VDNLFTEQDMRKTMELCGKTHRVSSFKQLRYVDNFFD